MLSSFNSGISGLQQFQQRMDVIGNNIANVNTTGFKSARVEFADTFSQSLESGGAAASTQVGSGVATSSIRSLFSQGSRTTTDNPTDLAIEGQGFFIVKDATTNVQYATRSGHFKLDNQGYLVNEKGLRVQGFSDSALSTRGDIKIDNTNDGTTVHAYLDPPANTLPAAVDGYRIDQEGKVHVVLNDGTKTDYVRGQVLLQNFKDPNALLKEGDGLYSGMDAAGPLASSAAPKTNGLGTINAGQLESSNVDLATEFSDMITTQRAFQASSRIITTSDEMLQDVVNLKR